MLAPARHALRPGMPTLLNGLVQARTVQFRHLKVGEDSIVMMLIKPVERLKTVAGGIDLVTLMSQNVGQQFTEDLFVVDHKDALLSHCLRARQQQGTCQSKMPASADLPDYCGAGNGQLLVGQGINPVTAQFVHTLHFGRLAHARRSVSVRDNLPAPCQKPSPRWATGSWPFSVPRSPTKITRCARAMRCSGCRRASRSTRKRCDARTGRWSRSASG